MEPPSLDHRRPTAAGPDGAPSRDGWLSTHLTRRLDRIDALILRAAASLQDALGVVPGADPFRGLYLRADDIEGEFARSPGAWWPDGDPKLTGSQSWDGDPEAGPPEGRAPALAWLAGYHGLDAFELDVLLLALAPEIDSRYGRAFAFLQDDVTMRRPTIELALRLFCRDANERGARRSCFGSSSRLIESRLVYVEPQPAGTGLGATLRVDEQIVHLLLGIQSLDSRLSQVLQWARESPARWAVPELWNPTLESITQNSRVTGRLLLEILGPAGSGRQALAAEIAKRLGVRMLSLEIDTAAVVWPDPVQFRERVHLALRQAWLSGALLFVSGLDEIDSAVRVAGAQPALKSRALAIELRGHPGRVILASSRPWVPPAGLLPDLASVDVCVRTADQREALWRRALRDVGLPGLEAASHELADRFRFTPGQIAEVAGRAAFARDGWMPIPKAVSNGSPAAESEAVLFSIARGLGGKELERHARRVRPLHQWDDLVLPSDSKAQLEELRHRVEGRRIVLNEWGFRRRMNRGIGVTALFTGPSGTGKTMAAEVLAGALGVDLFAIDLASVLSKYIGEIERNLDRVFRAAESANGVLFFDEADALFGKRSEVRDSHDRYANIEISYLLQKMEEYDGVAILATNLRDNLDDAFVRRLAFSVHFPFPDRESRLRIWQSVWPSGVPLEPNLSLVPLADLLLSGGSIRNVALAAAHLAAADGDSVSAEAIARAVRREYQKLGKHVDEDQLRTSFHGPAVHSSQADQ